MRQRILFSMLVMFGLIVFPESCKQSKEKSLQYDSFGVKYIMQCNDSADIMQKAVEIIIYDKYNTDSAKPISLSKPDTISIHCEQVNDLVDTLSAYRYKYFEYLTKNKLFDTTAESKVYHIKVKWKPFMPDANSKDSFVVISIEPDSIQNQLLLRRSKDIAHFIRRLDSLGKACCK